MGKTSAFALHQSSNPVMWSTGLGGGEEVWVLAAAFTAA